MMVGSRAGLEKHRKDTAMISQVERATLSAAQERQPADSLECIPGGASVWNCLSPVLGAE